MNRPRLTEFAFPKVLGEVPLPIARPGVLLQNNAGFRSMRPGIDPNRCVDCRMCWLLCPEGAIFQEAGRLTVDLDFCKGCGICACECRAGAIRMVAEGERNEEA